MFDPSKLDIDFSSASPEDIQKFKEAQRQKQLENLEATKPLEAPWTPELQKEVADDIANDPLAEVNAEVPIVITPKKDAVDTIIDKEKQETKLAENPQLKPKNPEVLSTIITDSELVDQDESLKNYKQEKELEHQEQKENEIEFDMLIKKLDDIIGLILQKWYEYVRIEPSEDSVKITFVKWWIDKEIKYIKYPVYSSIIIQAKNSWKLKLDVTDQEQKWTGFIVFNGKKYKTAVKTKPHSFGESAFFKIDESVASIAAKKKEKLSFTKILWYLLALLFTSLFLWALFLGFILFNSNTVDDLKLFKSFGVDVGQVREFVSGLVNVVFLLIVFIQTVFAGIFIFKALLTKKEYKKKKVNAIILSAVLIITTLTTAFAWLTLAQKINQLKWENYGQAVIYDNIKLNSDFYDDARLAIINPESDIIWPITLKFEIEELLQRLEDTWYDIKWLTWDFNWEKISKPAASVEIIQEFTDIWANTVTLEIETTNIAWEEEIIEEEIADLDIVANVEILVRKTTNGWKTYVFDASSLSNQWNIQWFYIPDLQKKTEEQRIETIEKALAEPAREWNVFSPQKIVFDDEIVIWMLIDEKWVIKTDLDKIFLMTWEGESDIEWSIGMTPAVDSDLGYTFYIEDVENDFASGFIESITWRIEGTEKTIDVDISDMRESSEIDYEFKEYGTKRIIAVLRDTSWNEKTIETSLLLDKRVTLTDEIIIYNDTTDAEIWRYNDKTNEYSVNNLWVPITVRLDARFVKPSNQIYRLEDVSWDFDSDNNIDETWTLVTHDIENSWSTHITVNYTFQHKRIESETITMSEDIFIESIKKDAILDLKIEKQSSYVPQLVRFDASRSEVQNDDIETFTFDYWDGTPKEVRDAINPWHRYTEAWNYTVTLEVQTKKWKTYSITETLNLLDQPQEVKISSSIKNTNTFQEISFFSDESNGQITSYYWEFGDGQVSTTANPEHSFEKPWVYNVKLTGTFVNNNVETDTLRITIK